MTDSVAPAQPTEAIIVVGTDFSDPSGRALTEARRLALLMGARVEVVHVSDGFHVRSWDALPANAARFTHCALDPALVTVRYGVPWVELVRHSETRRAAMLVVGSHGATGTHWVGLGGTASRVATQARCPVVVVNGRMDATDKDGMADRDGAAALARQTRDSIMETG